MRSNYTQPPVSRIVSPAGRSSNLIRRAAARATAILVAGSGALNLLSLLGGPVPSEVPDWLRGLLPLDFGGLSRSLTLLLGFALMLSAIHLWALKRRALKSAILLSVISALLHLTKRWNVEEAMASLAVVGLLLYLRPVFRVGSGTPRLLEAVRRTASALSIAIVYGVSGFWLLKSHELGQNFHWWQAAKSTLRFMAFVGDASLVPHTAYAAWFLDSLYWMSAAVVLYAGVVLFRPVVYQFSPDVQGQERARELTGRYGLSGQDYFKQANDKSFFFSRTGRSYLSYRVARNFALVLGDPLGPTHESRMVLEEFVSFCQRKGWRVGFHQVGPARLACYEALGFRTLKIGDDAIVDLSQFSLQGSAMKEFRNTVNRLDRLGYRVQRFDPPVEQRQADELQQVSDLWLAIPGHRERQFTLGRFDPDYVESVPVYIVFDKEDRIAAFLNLIPSYRPGLATVDLMRRRPDSANGIMDYLFAKVFLALKAEGYKQFSLGMAPVAMFSAEEKPTLDEKTVQWIMKSFPSLFRADSLRRFKAKYAHVWEPRYEVYQSRWDLPRLALALRSVAEIPKCEAA